MKKAKLFLSGFLFGLVICLNIYAQPLCGGIPSVNLTVRDTEDERVPNARVELIPLGADDTGGQRFVRVADDGSSFEIKFDRFVRGEYKLVVSAAGFETSEERIKFSDCVSRTVYLISKSEPTAIINGTFFDKDKIAILRSPGRLVFTNEKNIRFEVSPDDFGRYRIKLPFGKYHVWAGHFDLNQFFECRGFVIDKKELEFDIYLREESERQDSEAGDETKICLIEH